MIDISVNDLLRSDEELLLKLNHRECAVFTEHDDVVDVGTVADIAVSVFVLLFLKACAGADEAFLLVDIQLLVVCSHSHSRDIVEVADFGLTLASFAVFTFYFLEIMDCVIHNMVEVVFHLLYLFLDVK